jgi:hypothetical protein
MGKTKNTAVMSPGKKTKSADACAGVPSVASLGNLVGGSSSMPPRVYDENINIAVLKYCTNGSVYDNKVFPAADMYALSLATGCQPSPIFWMMKVQELYGKSTQGSANPQPIDSESFRMAYQTKLEFVSKKTTDPDAIGWRKNGLCYYVGAEAGKAVESIKELIMYLDNVITWRVSHSDEVFEKIPTVPKLVIHVPEGLALAFQDDDEMSCAVEVKQLSCGGMTTFDLAPPVFPGRLVVLTFELVDTDTTHIIFSGNTKPFMKGFQDLQIKGKSMKLNEADDYGEYFRVYENLSLIDPAAATTYLSKLHRDCLHCSPIVLRVMESTVNRVKLQVVLDSMKDMTNVRLDS